jgi:hypothetical protein
MPRTYEPVRRQGGFGGRLERREMCRGRISNEPISQISTQREVIRGAKQSRSRENRDGGDTGGTFKMKRATKHISTHNKKHLTGYASESVTVGV